MDNDKHATVDRLLLGVVADMIQYALTHTRGGLSEDTRAGLEAALMLVEKDVAELAVRVTG